MIRQSGSQAGPTATGTDMTGSKSIKNRRKRYFHLFIAAVIIAAFLYILWEQGMFLPGWIQWKDASFKDASSQYEIVLNSKKVEIGYDFQIIWNSPDSIKVQDVLSADLDCDSKDELILLCWKKGRYGKYRPFWVEKDEKKWSQHIFVYEYENEQIKPKWMSSYIGQDVVKIETNTKKDSICHLLLTDTDGTISSWVWDSWGFTKEEIR